MRAGGEILQALDDAGKGVQAASTELAGLIGSFLDAHIDENGEIQVGLGLEFKAAFDDEIATIYKDAIEGERQPPAKDIREAMAHRAVQTKRPALWANYHREKARIDALKSWIINQKASISANQTLMKAEAA